jgi:hypothetical protein
MTNSRRDKSVGLLLILGGCLPFAVGPLIMNNQPEGFPQSCLVRAVTGLPCPLCGGTRAFAYASSGDPKFLSYNAFWVFIALASIAVGIVIVLTRVSLDRFWSRWGNLPLYMVTGALALGWAYALLNRATIIPA